MRSLSDDILCCLFYLVARFEHVQNFQTDTTDKSYTCLSVLLGICAFIICFVLSLYVMCPVFVRLMTGDV